jgi:hypothetical protein
MKRPPAVDAVGLAGQSVDRMGADLISSSISCTCLVTQPASALSHVHAVPMSLQAIMESGYADISSEK